MRIELWGDEVDSISYFDPESQRRTDPIDEITVFPALEIIFPDTDDLVTKLEALSKSVRGSRTDKIRTNISRDIETAQSGITLTNLDKYYTVCYDKLTTILTIFKAVFALCRSIPTVSKGQGGSCSAFRGYEASL